GEVGGRGAETPGPGQGRLLGAGRERPHCAAAEKRDELTALHSITSSASNCIELETVRPRALGGLEVDHARTQLVRFIVALPRPRLVILRQTFALRRPRGVCDLRHFFPHLAPMLRAKRA